MNDAIEIPDASREPAAYVEALLATLGDVWLTVFARVVQRARRVLTRADVRRWLERGTGAVLVALGIRMALERR